jgi:pilus assembly protein CpaC
VRSHRRTCGIVQCCIAAFLMAMNAPLVATGQNQPPAAQTPTAGGPEETEDELFVTVGKSVIVSSVPPIVRAAVGFGEVAEATAVGPHEVLLSGKAPGSTSLIIWQENGGKLFFNVTVRPNLTVANIKLEGLRRELRQELPGQKIVASMENDNVFLRGTVKDLISADRAVAIASTLGKTVNLLYVDVPGAQDQILLKVRFASVDRTASSELGLNLFSTGAANNIGRVTTGQFSAPDLQTTADGKTTFTLSDALNLFLFRPDINLGATIKALQRKALLEILAEPNVLAIDGKQASFLAGGEYPYPILQGGGAGLGTVTIQFREFGVRINFIPTITPRGTIRLEVAPEVSALDFANGLVFQGFTIPALTVRRVNTGVELAPGQSFAIGGLLDRRLTETISKVPLLADVPLLGKIFRSRSLNRENSELLVIVTPELVRPIEAGQPLALPEYPKPVTGLGSDTPITNPVIGPAEAGAQKPRAAMPVETLVESLKQEQARSLAGGAPGSGSAGSSGWQPQTQLQPPPLPAAASPASAPAMVKPAPSP